MKHYFKRALHTAVLLLAVLLAAVVILCGCGGPSEPASTPEPAGKTSPEAQPEATAQQEPAATQEPMVETASVPEPEPVLPDEVWLVPEAVTASSELPAEGNNSYNAYLVDDHDPSTAWVEGVKGTGAGEFLELSYPAGTVITGGTVFPAYCKSDETFRNNAAATLLELSSGGVSYTVDVSAYTRSYTGDYEGFRFVLATPLVCDGTVRVTIRGVRNGAKYEDTCISELQLCGYAGNSAFCYALNANGYMYPDDAALAVTMASHALRRRNYSDYDPAGLRFDSLTPDERAFLMYWYQYNVPDARIASAGEYNTASLTDLKTIYRGLTGLAPDAGFDAFTESYVEKQDGELCYMQGCGDFGDAGAYYFTDPVILGISDGRMLVNGSVMRYDSASGGYKAAAAFTLCLVRDENGLFGGWVADELFFNSLGQ